jgi:hypothetical protein
MKLIPFGNRANACLDKLRGFLAERLVEIGRLHRGPCPRDWLLVVSELREFRGKADGLAIVAGSIRFFDFREFCFHDCTLASLVPVARVFPRIKQIG